MASSTHFPVPYALITLQNAETDAIPPGEHNKKLAIPGNNGRKIFATTVMHQFGEELIVDPVWRAPSVFPTGDGGIEVATFTEFSGQDRHRHEKGTEIYTVLRGELEIYINDTLIQPLCAGDEIVIPPGTIHEVVQPTNDTPSDTPAEGNDFKLVVRVHSISCYGVDDKYVQLNPKGSWLKWSHLSKEQRAAAYKKQ